MKTRVLSGLLMAPLLGIIYLGGYFLLAFVVLLSVVGLHEFNKGFNNMGIKPSTNIGIGATAALYAFHQLMGGEANVYLPIWIVLVVIAVCLELLNVNKKRVEDVMATLIGIVYIVLFAYHMVLIENLPDYSILIWLTLLSAFGTDTMAYFSGFLFGKHKLCPNLSPKKTIEGAIGGAIGSVIFTGLFGLFFAKDVIVHCIIIGIIGGVFSQFGDLTASAFKRKMGIKDFGNLIPGHGGVMDRVDSLIFIAPLVYYYITIVIM